MLLVEGVDRTIVMAMQVPVEGISEEEPLLPAELLAEVKLQVGPELKVVVLAQVTLPQVLNMAEEVVVGMAVVLD